MTEYKVLHNKVLVATYIPPPRIMRGPNGEAVQFHVSDKAQLDDRFQGKCGLVLKMGPLAFKDDNTVKFGGEKLEVGDWAIYRPSDGTEMFIRDRLGGANDGISVRVIDDTLIMGSVDDPSLIY
jgi:hypothetical protein